MAYVDRDRSRETALSGVAAALLVGGIGFVLATGLAMTVAHDPEHHLLLNNWREPSPPPPPPPLKTMPQAAPHPVPTAPQIVETIVPPLPRDATTIVLPRTDFTLPESGSAAADATPSSPPGPADRSTRAIPRGDPGAWVTSEDYPTAALRDGQQGATGFCLDIGADGRATACTVTATSGSDALDQATCRTLMRRARFAPARDATGAPVATSYASRIRWRLPAD